MPTNLTRGLALLVVTAACGDGSTATTEPSSPGASSGGSSGGGEAPPGVGGTSMMTGGSPPASGGAIAAAGSSAGADPDPPTTGGSPPMGTGGTAMAGAPPTAGGSPSMSTGGDGAAGSSAGSGSQALSFETDIWPMFTKIRDPVFVYPGGSTYESCVTVGVCHGGETPGAGLRMPDPETAYGMLLGAPSVSGLCAGTIRVVTGDPDNSCLILFYEGRLRDDLGWVDTAEIDLVREWIAQGALP